MSYYSTIKNSMKIDVQGMCGSRFGREEEPCLSPRVCDISSGLQMSSKRKGMRQRWRRQTTVAIMPWRTVKQNSTTLLVRRIWYTVSIQQTMCQTSYDTRTMANWPSENYSGVPAALNSGTCTTRGRLLEKFDLRVLSFFCHMAELFVLQPVVSWYNSSIMSTIS